MDNKSAKWLDKYDILDPDHVQELETSAAIGEFHSKKPRHEAEDEAYDKYKRSKLVESAAHHLVGTKAAYAAGDKETAKKHAAMMMLALKGIGHDNPLDPPPEVLDKAKNTPASITKFRAHPGDAFTVKDHE